MTFRFYYTHLPIPQMNWNNFGQPYLALVLGYREFIYHSISAVEEMEIWTTTIMQDINEAHQIS